MGDIIDNKLEERKAKFKHFFRNNLKLENKNLLYLVLYIILMLIIYFVFKDKIRFGKDFLFIILPIISIILFLFKKPTLAILLNIIGFSFIFRLQNLDYLIDVTTKSYIPADPDAMAFLRYSQYINAHGSLMSIDTLRYFPDGFSGLQEFSFLSHFIVYLYKFLSIFSSSLTLELVDIIYPPIAFAISMIFFFLLVKNLFNKNVALLSTAFLAFIPSYLFRTLTGISDKEAFATIFLFAAFYFYVLSWKSEKNSKAILFGGIAGVSTALANLIWGGGVFIFLVVGMFTIIEILLNKFDKKDFYAYLSWIFFSIIVLMILYGSKYNLGTVLLSSSTSIAILALVYYISNHFFIEKNLLRIKDKISNKLPPRVFSFILTLIILSILLFIIFGNSYFTGLVKQTFNAFVTPFATDRWVRTVAENSQPYITDWISNFGRYYLWLFIIGSIVLFYEMHKNLKSAFKLTIIYTLFILGIIFSRSSPSSLFNGINTISVLVYLTSLIGLFLLFTLPYLYSYYKNKDAMEEIQKFSKKYLFILIWFIIMIIAARGAVRLLFIFSPITAILASYLIFEIVELSKKLKGRIYVGSSILVMGVISLLLLSNFATTTVAQASSVGPTYNQQWQYMGQWIRDNTKGDAVFAHWWDYGYLVQYNNRATISDGGNAGGYEINYFTGRHVLTAQSEREALEYLKSKDVTHLLIVSDEIGKYPAFSSIGSDVNYDRYSWITNFILDPQQTTETRNQTLYLYRGGFPLDEDLIYNNKVYPRQSAGIGAIVLPIEETKENNVSGFNIKQPSAILVYNSEQVQIPLNCIYINNQKIEFNTGIDACFRVVPVINNDEVNPIGAGLFLSPKVKNSLLAELYLYNKESDYFKVGYSDESQIPLAIYNGRFIGPYKIWEINYPSDLKVPEEYYKKELPDTNVVKIKEEYY